MISTYINELLDAGFIIKTVKEPAPLDQMLKDIPEMLHETRRPMFLIILAENL